MQDHKAKQESGAKLHTVESRAIGPGLRAKLSQWICIVLLYAMANQYLWVPEVMSFVTHVQVSDHTNKQLSEKDTNWSSSLAFW